MLKINDALQIEFQFYYGFTKGRFAKFYSYSFSNFYKFFKAYKIQKGKFANI